MTTHDEMPAEFWSVYNYLATQWYANEYNHPAHRQGPYHIAMLLLECLASREAHIEKTMSAAA